MRRRERVEQSVTYEFNGVKYHRLEDMPPQVREMFIDRDGNGIPDTFDALMQNSGGSTPQVFKTERRFTRTIVPGTEFKSVSVGPLGIDHMLDDLPSSSAPCCARCGEDLHGMKIGGTCSTCGYPVTHSIQLHASGRSSTITTVLREHAWLIVLMLAAAAYLIYRLIF